MTQPFFDCDRDVPADIRKAGIRQRAKERKNDPVPL
jgi:hypothetical protein